MAALFKLDHYSLNEFKIEFHYESGPIPTKQWQFRDTIWSVKPFSECPQMCTIKCILPRNATMYFKVDNSLYCFSKNFFTFTRLSSTKRRSSGTQIHHLTLHVKDITLVNPTKLNEKSELDDVVVNINSHKLNLNKTLLAYHSPKFKSLLLGDNKETVTEMKLIGKDFDRFFDFLSSFYNIGESFTDSIMVEFSVLRAAYLYSLYNEYQMTKYVSMCDTLFDKYFQTINRGEVSEKNSVPILCSVGIIAEHFDKEDLLKKTIFYLSKINLKLYKNEKPFTNLNETTKYKIMDLAFDRMNNLDTNLQ